MGCTKLATKLLITVGLSLFLTACLSVEYKLQSILDKQIGKSKFIEKTRLELDSVFGKQDSKLKTSILDFVSDRVEVDYTDILVDGKKARVKVVAHVPKLDELGALVIVAGSLPRDRMLEMKIEDVLIEIAKSSRRPASYKNSFTDIRNEVYEFSIDFEKGKEWVANPEQISRAFSKRNLISQR